MITDPSPPGILHAEVLVLESDIGYHQALFFLGGGETQGGKNDTGG